MRTAFVIPALLAAAATLRAGTIVTTDGQTLTGDLKRTDDGWAVTQDDGTVKIVGTRMVKSIELGGDAAKPGRDYAGLQSLRRSVEFSDDLPKIVLRYQTFINQAKDAQILSQARQDQATWQARLDQGLIKVGKNWVTPAERNAINRRLREQAEQVRLLIKDRRDRDAEQAVNDALAQDPLNASALYLRGVLAQQRRDLGEAKKAFLAVQQTLPQHAPTLVNLAIILNRQRQWAAGAVAMQQALEAAPMTQSLLDTAVEFIHLVPPEVRRGGAVQKLARVFLAQDERMQAVMAAKHLHRWGAGWIETAAYDKLKATGDDVQKKLADLQKDFDAAQQKMATIDKQTADNDRAMRDIEAHSYTRTADGTVVRVPLSRTWYDLQDENARLRQDQADQDTKLAKLRDDAQATQKLLPVPTYSGVLTPIGEDGVPLPVLPEETATTAPATTPATEPSSVIRIGPPDPP